GGGTGGDGGVDARQVLRGRLDLPARVGRAFGGYAAEGLEHLAAVVSADYPRAAAGLKYGDGAHAFTTANTRRTFVYLRPAGLEAAFSSTELVMPRTRQNFDSTATQRLAESSETVVTTTCEP